MTTAPTSDSTQKLERDVVEICRELLMIDTTNFGDNSGPGERKAAEYAASLLDEIGLEVTLLESAPGRANIVTRIAGTDPEAPALLVHGHLDVVPARPDEWTQPPFEGVVEDDCLWGRGAVDMKDMDAMILATVRAMARDGERPRRDLVIALMADEEAGGDYGARWLATEHPDLFDGVTEAVSEVGGFSVDLEGRRAYLLQTAEKGIEWLRLVAHGTAQHGSQVPTDNAVTRLAAAVSRIGAHEWPLELTPTVRDLLRGIEEIIGRPLPPDDLDELTRVLGTTANFVGATLRNTSNPTRLDAGYKENVIPGDASAVIDCRYLPGLGDDLLATVRELAGDGVELQTLQSAPALEAPFEGALVDRMIEALAAEDPGAAVLPYCLSGGTDNKAFHELGVVGYGFAPLRLPAGMDFAGMFHGVDERVPLDSLRFGARTLRRFLRTA